MQRLTGKAGTRLGSAIALLVVAVLIALTPVRGQAQANTVLRFTPQPLSVEEGITFTVDVWVEDVADLYGAQVYLDFEPSVLEVTNVEAGTLLTAAPMSSLTFDNALGQVDFYIFQMAPSPPVSGSGSLATITFRGKAAGASPLQFVTRDDNPALRTLLTTAEIPGEIPTVKQDGQATVYSLARLAIDPSSTSVTAGQAITYVARVYDTGDSLVDTVTGSTTFGISTGAGGSWLGTTYTSDKAGAWTITGSYVSPGGKELVDTASLTVAPAAPSSLDLTAGASDLMMGGNTTVTATLSDAHSNSAADGTVVTFTCDHGVLEGGITTIQAGTLNGVATTTFTAATAGTATLTATAGSAVDSTQITIHQTPPTCYTLTLGHTGNGTDPVASPAKSGICAGNSEYVAGESITLSGAVPDSGWQIAGWDGTSSDGSTADSNSLIMPAGAHTAIVSYSAIGQEPAMHTFFLPLVTRTR